MKRLPAEIAYIRETFNTVAQGVVEAFDDTETSSADSPEVLVDAFGRLLDLLQSYENQGENPAPCYQSEQTQPLAGREISELGDYGLDLLDRFTILARKQGLGEAVVQLESLAFALAIWLVRNDGEILTLEPVVNGLARLANQNSDPHYLEELCLQIEQLTEAVSPSISQDLNRANPARPWRILLLNWGIVATRSLRPPLMRNAFDNLLERLPDEAETFFREGMGQMDALDYPPHVREVMETYFETWSLKKTLH